VAEILEPIMMITFDDNTPIEVKQELSKHMEGCLLHFMWEEDHLDLPLTASYLNSKFNLKSCIVRMFNYY
jgi:hypothetical protein